MHSISEWMRCATRGYHITLKKKKEDLHHTRSLTPHNLRRPNRCCWNVHWLVRLIIPVRQVVMQMHRWNSTNKSIDLFFCSPLSHRKRGFQSMSKSRKESCAPLDQSQCANIAVSKENLVSDSLIGWLVWPLSVLFTTKILKTSLPTRPNWTQNCIICMRRSRASSQYITRGGSARVEADGWYWKMAIFVEWL